MIRLPSVVRASLSQLRECWPTVSLQYRCQNTELSSQDVADSRPGVPMSAEVQPPSMEGYWTQSRLKKEYQKLSRLLQERDRENHLSRVLNIVKLCSGPQLLERPEVKVEMAEAMCKDIFAKGVKRDVNIFNILLRVYNFNEAKVVPSEFLEQMKDSGVNPNLGTFALLIDAYCYQGNVVGASKLLEYMRSLDMPISERIYASLVTGHARAGDMEAAAGILETMKKNGLIPHNIVYTSLLCAHAERGDMQAIEAVFSQMRSERLFPSMMTYIQVMNSLSLHGYGAMVSDVLNLVKNREWLSLDFRNLTNFCLSRGEVVAPRILIGELSQHQGLRSDIIIYYITQCLSQGQEVTEVIRDLKKDVDFSQFPNLYENLIAKVVHSHKPVVVGEADGTRPPDLGALAPHPSGADWGGMLLRLYQLAMEDGAEVMPHFYYPLMARYCSEGNVDGIWQVARQVVSNGIPFQLTMKAYLAKTLDNAGTTEQESVQAMLGQHEEGSEALMEDAFFLALFYCSDGRFADASQMVSHLRGSDVLTRRSRELHSALRQGSDVSPKLSSVTTKLLKTLQEVSPSLSVEDCLLSCLQGYFKGKMMSYPEISLFFSELQHAGMHFSKSKVYLALVPALNIKYNEMFRKLCEEVSRGEGSKQLQDEDYIVLFQGAVQTRNYGLGEKFYRYMSITDSERSDLKEDYLMCLSNIKHQIPSAIRLLNDMLDAGHTPRYGIWMQLIRQLLKVDSVGARNLVEKMKFHGLEPDSQLRHLLLEYYVLQGQVEAATAEFEGVVASGQVSRRSYGLMARLWAEKGNVEETSRYIEEAIKQPSKVEDNMMEFLLVAHLKNGSLDEVMKVVESGQLQKVSMSTVSELLQTFLSAGHSLEELLATLKGKKIATEDGILSDTVLNTALFFSAVDSANETVTAAALKALEQLDQALFEKKLMTKSHLKYLRVLMKNQYHLRDVKCAYQMRTGYVLTENNQGLQQLRKSLEEANKSDWLWQKL